MSAIYEGRTSDSPYIEMIWRGRALQAHSPLCPADPRWNLLLIKYQGKIRVSVEGPTTKTVLKNQLEGAEFQVIKFKSGIFMQHLPPGNLVDGDVVLPEAGSKSFWLYGSAWQFPDHDDIEGFVDRLVRDEVLVRDPVVTAALQNQPQDISSRTVRRRFLQATGLTPKTFHQIERAQQAAALLEQGVPILDATYQLGYADQPHLTRSLKRFIGNTPAQIAHLTQSG